MNYEIINNKYEKLVINIKKYFEQSDKKIFEARNTIKVIDYQNEKIAIKSFKIPNIVNRFVYKWIRESKAKRSYLNSKKLIDLQINTSRPIAYVEFGSFLFSNSYYLSSLIDFDYEIKDVINDENYLERKKILKEFIYFSKNLHDKGVYHVDYSPGNVLIKKTNESYLFYLVDVNRMKFYDFDLEDRFMNLAKMFSNEKDLKFVTYEYASLLNEDFNKCFELLMKHRKNHENYLERKKNLKKLKAK